MTTTTLLLSASDLEKCLDMSETVTIVEEVFRAHGEGKVVMPAKVGLDLSALGIPHAMSVMPAYVAPVHLCGIKFVGGFPNNPAQHQLPYIMGSLALFDPYTGVMVAVMDARPITSMRTGATAALAARYLARVSASTAAFVGCGTQARASLQALKIVSGLTKIRAVDVSRDASERLVREAQLLGYDAQAVGSIPEAVEGADFVLVATTAAEPLVKRAWVKPGACVVKLGSYQELDDELTLGADKLVVDHRTQAEHKGELAHLFAQGRITQDQVYGELGDIISGLVPGREREDEVIVAALIGIGSVDIGVGGAVLRRAREMGLGQTFDFLA